MGYWFRRSAAGQNKTHKSTAQARRLDSFSMREKALRQNLSSLDIDIDGIATKKILFDWVSNNYDKEGSKKRLYFLCPKCSERVRFLYILKVGGHLHCRKCSMLNYPIQQVAKGPRVYEERIKAILEKLRYNVDLCPMDMADVIPPRPYYMHIKTYHKYLVQLKKAQLLWYEDFANTIAKICRAIR